MGNFAENLNLGNRFRPPPENLNFLHIFAALLLEAHSPKGIWLEAFQYEIRAIFTENSRTREFIQHSRA